MTTFQYIKFSVYLNYLRKNVEELEVFSNDMINYKESIDKIIKIINEVTYTTINN